MPGEGIDELSIKRVRPTRYYQSHNIDILIIAY